MYETITKEEIEAGQKAIMGGNVGGKFDLIVKKAYGSTIEATDGRKFLDCTSQAWSCGIGFNHPKVNKAVQEQVELFSHIRTSFDTIPKLLLSKKEPVSDPEVLFHRAGDVHGKAEQRFAVLGQKRLLTCHPALPVIQNFRECCFPFHVQSSFTVCRCGADIPG
jgi:hypothetical protein